jgi:hypothetical protein
MKMYFKGGSGIEEPVDFNGERIKEGDILTHSWFEGDYLAFFKKHLNTTEEDDDKVEKRVHEPSVVVKFNKEKGFYYGQGIDKYSYMHDFMFKFTKIVKQ